MNDNVFTLENEYAKLMPLTMDNYQQLYAIASEHKLVQYSPADIENREGLKAYVEKALEQQRNKLAIPFIIYDKKKQ